MSKGAVLRAARLCLAALGITLLLAGCYDYANNPCNQNLHEPDVSKMQLYPGARDVVSKPQTGQSAGSLTYRTGGRPEDLISFYDESMTEDGWMRVKSTALPVGELSFEWNNCCRVGWAHVKARSLDAGTSDVVVEYDMQGCE